MENRGIVGGQLGRGGESHFCPLSPLLPKSSPSAQQVCLPPSSHSRATVTFPIKNWKTETKGPGVSQEHKAGRSQPPPDSWLSSQIR